MIVRCAWCRRIISKKPPYGGKYDRQITDGICGQCLEKYFSVKETGCEQIGPAKEDNRRTS